ncbi:3-deoxy-D-manno-octulosonic acid transferase [Synechococcus sp. GFB01]|uniref:3-deoxy-D-manno-octulosonic acid transferase n=1 Tax=Synechococcus sp. GFB01 TaxID=1662190 RepID=UPI00069EC720|nr:glycosyltransferase N-terminal domain-containing protein [Synechococcus sp. GFB01]
MTGLLLLLYRLLVLLLTPLLLLVLLWRLLQGKEDPRRLGERLGVSRRRRPPGPLVWLHAASVGELNSLLPLLRQLSAPGGPALLLTTVTRTAAALAPSRLPPRVIHQYVPLDHWLTFLLFQRHWRPALGVLAEAELWPELIHAMPRAWLINARMSERSFRRHCRHRWFAAWLLGRFQTCLAQSPQDAERFRRLGAHQVQAVGSTKRDAEPPRVEAAIVERLADAFAGRRVLLLASSHAGEEASLLEAYPGLRRRLPTWPCCWCRATRSGRPRWRRLRPAMAWRCAAGASWPARHPHRLSMLWWPIGSVRWAPGSRLPGWW